MLHLLHDGTLEAVSKIAAMPEQLGLWAWRWADPTLLKLSHDGKVTDQNTLCKQRSDFRQPRSGKGFSVTGTARRYPQYFAKGPTNFRLRSFAKSPLVQTRHM